MKLRILNDKIITVGGGFFLLALVLSSWFPQPCPLLRSKLGNCPQSKPNTLPPTEEQKEVARFPHQEITNDYLFIDVKAQAYKKQTNVHFYYQTDLSKFIAYLQLKKPSGFEDMSLVSHPVLADLTWNSISTPEFHLFQRDPHYDSLDDFLTHLPAASKLAADPIVARRFNLQDSQYTPLDPLENLDAISYVFTTFAPPTKDGKWLFFNQTFDAESAEVTKEDKLIWALRMPANASRQNKVLVSTIYVNYTQVK